jgi:hypothetical protein
MNYEIILAITGLVIPATIGIYLSLKYMIKSITNWIKTGKYKALDILMGLFIFAMIITFSFGMTGLDPILPGLIMANIIFYYGVIAYIKGWLE